MTQPFNLKTLNTLFGLLTEEELASEFGKFKLKHKLNLIKQLSNGDETTNSVVEYLIENVLSSPTIALDSKEIYLTTYYSSAEVRDINLTLGLPETNLTLKEELLDNIYNERNASAKIKELYYQLKSRHFKPPSYYLDDNHQGLTNVTDRLQYQKEMKNDVR